MDAPTTRKYGYYLCKHINGGHMIAYFNGFWLTVGASTVWENGEFEGSVSEIIGLISEVSTGELRIPIIELHNSTTRTVL